LTWRAIDLGIDQISYVCKALATIAISLHHECYRTLAPLSPLAGSNTRLCVAIEQLPRYSNSTATGGFTLVDASLAALDSCLSP
jgi:hypothetical protein